MLSSAVDVGVAVPLSVAQVIYSIDVATFLDSTIDSIVVLRYRSPVRSVVVVISTRRI